MTRAARLNTRCVFQSAANVADGGGGNSLSWSTEFTIWGGFSFPNLGSRMEGIAAGAIQTVAAGELIVRESKATRRITGAWRVVETTDPTISPATQETWNIRRVEPRQRDGFIRMQVETGVPI